MNDFANWPLASIRYRLNTCKCNVNFNSQPSWCCLAIPFLFSLGNWYFNKRHCKQACIIINSINIGLLRLQNQYCVRYILTSLQARFIPIIELFPSPAISIHYINTIHNLIYIIRSITNYSRFSFFISRSNKIMSNNSGQGSFKYYAV